MILLLANRRTHAHGPYVPNTFVLAEGTGQVRKRLSPSDTMAAPQHRGFADDLEREQAAAHYDCTDPNRTVEAEGIPIRVIIIEQLCQLA